MLVYSFCFVNHMELGLRLELFLLCLTCYLVRLFKLRPAKVSDSHTFQSVLVVRASTTGNITSLKLTFESEAYYWVMSWVHSSGRRL